MKKNLSLILLLSVALFACKSKQSQESEPESKLAFSMNFFRAVLEQSKDDETVFVSPYSAGVALSMLTQGAEGETLAELQKALNYCDFANEDLGAKDSVIVKSSNSVWLDKNFQVKKNYMNFLEKNYSAVAATRHFADPSTVQEINKWCSDSTEGKINSILERIDPSVVMILANALYFKAPWEMPFREFATNKSIFHSVKGDKEVDFMNQTTVLRYAEFAGNQLVELPYKGGRYAMYVVLPSPKVKASDLHKYLNEAGYLEAKSALSPERISLSFPKLKIDYLISLEPTLHSMGIQAAFRKDADFSRMTSEKVSVSQVLQKTFLEVDEKGSEAAAVTAIMVSKTSLGVPSARYMIVDRPFYLFIADTTTDNILFAGRVTAI